MSTSLRLTESDPVGRLPVLDRDVPLCLMLAPFGGSWTGVYESVANALDGIGVAHSWVGAKADVGGPFKDYIQDRLIEAEMVIADISDFNPNVMYELGFAHALKKPVLLVIRKGQPFPFDLMGHLVFVYDPGDPDALAHYVALWAQRHAAVVAAG
jgi:hypothetical protein